MPKPAHNTVTPNPAYNTIPHTSIARFLPDPENFITNFYCSFEILGAQGSLSVDPLFKNMSYEPVENECEIVLACSESPTEGTPI